ncbi:DUF6445 family protein [Aurantiacibacter sp. MUD11]|uniref:DUF6445 family protein n=1 Tax=Aurantiacibacter sp. MUD11 TaxID=3003265 RepID=UPI002ED33D18
MVRNVGRSKSPVMIVDGLLANPKEWVRYAEEQIEFSSDPELLAHYPGVRALAPDVYLEQLTNVLGLAIADTFDFRIERSIESQTMFSVTTTDPNELTVMQRVPHYDGVGSNALAAVHYLFEEDYGGTAFYRQVPTGIEVIDSGNVDDYKNCLPGDGREEAVGGGYFVSSNENFRQIGKVRAKFNRLMIYRGQLLHSGMVNADAGLPSQPGRGRLTLNCFMRQA